MIAAGSDAESITAATLSVSPDGDGQPVADGITHLFAAVRTVFRTGDECGSGWWRYPSRGSVGASGRAHVFHRFGGGIAGIGYGIAVTETASDNFAKSGTPLALPDPVTHDSVKGINGGRGEPITEVVGDANPTKTRPAGGNYKPRAPKRSTAQATKRVMRTGSKRMRIVAPYPWKLTRPPRRARAMTNLWISEVPPPIRAWRSM